MADNRLGDIPVAELKRIRSKGLDDITNLTNKEKVIYDIMDENTRLGIPNYGKAIQKGRGGTFKGTF